MLDFDQKIRAIQSVLTNIVRIGTVTSLKESEARARVVFEDRNQTESYDLQVIVKNTQENKDYAMPDIGEQVLCLFLPIGIEAGFILGSFYTNDNARPASAASTRKTEFNDGTTLEYDRESHTMSVDIPESGELNLTVNGPVNVTATDKVTVSAPEIDLGESGLEPVVLGDKLASWISSELKAWLDAHTHTSSSPGSPSSPPISPFSEGTGASGGAVYSTKNTTQ